MNEGKALFNSNCTDLTCKENKQISHVARIPVQDRMEVIYNKLLHVLETKKIYLDSNLNLTQLSLVTCTNTSYLSKTINRKFHCNLKTLLNKYRIEHAKKLLMQEDCPIQTLPERCGFVSRSTFYAAFVKFEHVTPTDFRAEYQSLNLLKKIENNINRLSTI